ncbi:hypothetical protein E2C01_034318 [Portunus trituberculatus]|uniref:Uncharacterized protein n=1 Tax=Portunus trituberculatus TaxID=210409 RepID=A0A5B7F2J2_PORTR|nr:hypothetical protein [Portunus trituberculatus]
MMWPVEASARSLRFSTLINLHLNHHNGNGAPFLHLLDQVRADSSTWASPPSIATLTQHSPPRERCGPDSSPLKLLPQPVHATYPDTIEITHEIKHILTQPSLIPVPTSAPSTSSSTSIPPAPPNQLFKLIL